MKKLLFVLLLVLFVVGMCSAAATSGDQTTWGQELDPAEVPFSYDPNLAPSKIIAWFECEVGELLDVAFGAHSPKGFPIELSLVDPPAGMVTDSYNLVEMFYPGLAMFENYIVNSLAWRPDVSQVGVHFVEICVSEAFTAPEVFMSSVCLVVHVYRLETDIPTIDWAESWTPPDVQFVIQQLIES